MHVYTFYLDAKLLESKALSTIVENILEITLRRLDRSSSLCFCNYKFQFVSAIKEILLIGVFML